MVAACYTSRNESDIIECSMRHALCEVDLVLVADGRSTDGTRAILDQLQYRHPNRLIWVDDPDPVHRQPLLTKMLADMAAERGADWVLCCDCDEFWVADDRRRSVKDVLDDCEHDAVYARRYQHHSWDVRFVEPTPGPKVAFRYRPDVEIANGNHGCSIPGVEGVLEIREIQYRSFEHLRRKARERTETLDPEALARGDGAYHPRFNAMSDMELRAWWDELHVRPTVHDPIPSRTTCRPLESTHA